MSHRNETSSLQVASEQFILCRGYVLILVGCLGRLEGIPPNNYQIIQISPKRKHINEHNFAKHINSKVSRLLLWYSIELHELKYVLEAIEINFTTAPSGWLHHHGELNEQ